MKSLLLAVLVTGCGSHTDLRGGSEKANGSRSERTPTNDGGYSADANAKNAQRTFAPGEDPTTGDLPGNDVPHDPNGSDPKTPPDPNGSDPKPKPNPTPSPTPAPAPAPAPTPDPPGSDPRAITRDMSFPASADHPAEVDHKLDQATLSQTITLHRNPVTKSKEVTQASRPTIEDDFQQGVGDKDITETYYGATNRLLDVLLVLDNGCHMDGIEQNYAAKLAPLLDSVASTDWQIGVATMDPNDTCVRAVVKKGDTNAAAALATALAVGTAGTTNPRGVLQAVRSLADTCQPKPWIRGGSQLEVVFVSNEDNCVDGTQCPGKAYAQGSYLTDYLATIRSVGRTARVHGVFMPPNVQACDCSLGKVPGKTYLDLVNATNGAWGSICNQDYAPVLGAIGTGAAAAVRTNFTLGTTPAAGTLSVSVDGAPLAAAGYTLSGNVLTLATPLGDGHQLKVVYRDVVTTPETAFTLRFAPVAGSVKVAVDGNPVDPAALTVDATVPSVTFKAAPAASAKIAVTYTRDVPLTTQFPLDDAPVAGTLMVTVDGAATTAYTFDAPSRTVTFATAPAEQAKIKFTYTVAGDPVLSYPLGLGPTAPAGLILVDATTGAAVSFTYANGQITLGAADYQDGRKLTATWPNLARDSFTITLAHDPLAGSVVAKSGAITCPAADLAVSGRDVAVAACPFPAGATDVLVDYVYTEFFRQFVFNAPNLPGPNDFQVWTVAIDGVATTAYTRAANIIMFDHDLPRGSTVKITLLQRTGS